jgi:hypothetical protein
MITIKKLFASYPEGITPFKRQFNLNSLKKVQRKIQQGAQTLFPIP